LDTTVLLIFGLVYLGMVLGEFPGLALDRTGIALLGAIALLATGRVTLAEAWQAIDVPTIALLFGLMVVSAQFRLGGFYTRVTQEIAGAQLSPRALLGLLIVVAGGLSALLANDIVCLAMAPVLTHACLKRGLNPLPFLLALACASNVGSAATLIGNPQSMLIGQALDLNFGRYLIDGGVPAVIGLGAVWLILCYQ
jgi:Na+/H+ antiporter NhaD/arsenite permease-like protein